MENNSEEIRIKIHTNTQKSKETIAKKIIELIKKYSKLCGLDTWAFFINFKKLNAGVLSQIEVEVHYYRADITFDLVKLEEYKDDKRLAEVVRHELLHCIVWRLAEVAQHLAPDEHKEFIQNFEEQVTTDLERLPVWELLTNPT